MTSLRFFAAIWVVFLHFGLPMAAAHNQLVGNLLSRGQGGVSLFFILSGFILGYVYLPQIERGFTNWKSFYLARFARIYPLYLFSLLLVFPGVVLYLSERRDLGVLVAAVPVQLALLQSWFIGLLYRGQWNTPSWSVSTEAFFYLSFPVLAALSLRLDRRGLWVAFTSLIALAFLERFAYWRLDPDQVGGATPGLTDSFWASLLFYNPIVRTLEFLLGLVAYRLWASQSAGATRYSELLWGVCLVSLPCFLLRETTANAMVLYPIALVGFVALIIGLASGVPSWFRRVFESPVLLLLGESSYGIYILQRPFSYWFERLTLKVSGQMIGTSVGCLLAFVITLCGFCCLTHRLIEQPSRLWLKRLGERRFGEKAA